MVLTLIFAQSSFAQDWVEQTVPVKIEKPGPDLPPVGSSLFDKMFYVPDRNAYSVPFPIAKLVDVVSHFSNGPKVESPSIFHVYFPFSRSLQRPVDLSYDPLIFPRIVFGLGGSGKPLLDRRLFWAYVEPKDQLEVISYNEEAGRFEFQVVKSYSKNPQVFYAQRAKCMTCHQGQTPIFPLNVWEDSASVIRNSMRVALMEAHGFLNDNRDEENLRRRLVGDTDKTSEAIAALDLSIRGAEALANFQRVYVHGCETRQCRLQLLLGELGTCLSSESHLEFECLSASDFALNSSKFRNVATIANSFIGDRLENQRKILGPLGQDDITRGQRLATSTEYKLKIIEDLKKLSKEDNPASSRLVRLDENTFFIFRAEMSSPFDVDSLFSSDLPYEKRSERLRTALIELYQEGSKIFDRRPLDNRELAHAVQIKLGKPLTDFGLPSFQSKSFASVLKEQIPTFFNEEALNALTRHCGSCHQTSDAYPNPFLTGSEDQVRENVARWKTRILLRIQNQEMPPSESMRRHFVDSKDRDLVVRYLETAAKHQYPSNL